MKTFLASALAALAVANEPFVIDAAEDVSNAIAVTQISGQQNFVMTSGRADPDPIKTANTESFYVTGIWNVDGTVMKDVLFTCKMQGV